MNSNIIIQDKELVMSYLWIVDLLASINISLLGPQLCLGSNLWA